MEFSFFKNPKGRLIAPDGTVIPGEELLAQANAVTNALRARGLQPGDAVGMCLTNSPEVFALYLGICQAGMYLIPINWHSAKPEVDYIVKDSGAAVLICNEQTAAICEGGVRLAELIAGASTATPLDRLAGGIMNYTSGTTGNPKGVRRPLPPCAPEPVVTNYAAFLLMYGLTPNAGVHLVCSPLYHTAVLYFGSSALHLGHDLVLMDGFSPEGFLQRCSDWKVDSSHMVPTHFVRLLTVENKGDYDLSSLKAMVHSAAPCPIPVKQEMLDWWGDCIYEYYAATEGGGTMVGPQDWREKPGTVGKPWHGADIAVHGDDGAKLGPDVPGTVYIKMAQGFEYHRDPEKTKKAWDVPGYFTVGDVGYLDSDGFLFLCDRKADLIISGGANIYPAEVESALITHPAVMDVAVFGIPNAEFGEEVKAVVEASGVTAEALLDWAHERLAKYKCPRSVDFVDALPRDPNGKLKKRLLRDPYWEGRKQI